MKNSDASRKSSLPDLDLPDWSAMLDSGRQASPRAALARIEECYRLFPKAAKRSRQQRILADFPEFKL
jgi:hypothetical protein